MTAFRLGNKYRAKRTEVDGVVFASKREAARYQELKALRRAGMIGEIELQPRFPLVVNRLKVCEYRADFAYEQDGRRIIEDVKSTVTRTPVYRLKKKLMQALYGITILET